MRVVLIGEDGGIDYEYQADRFLGNRAVHNFLLANGDIETRHYEPQHRLPTENSIRCDFAEKRTYTRQEQDRDHWKRIRDLFLEE